MIVLVKPTIQTNSNLAWQSNFLAMLPQLQHQAQVAFRGVRPELKEELVAEVTANACVAYARLVERGKGHLAYATPLATYAIRQVPSGRRVGSRLNGRDIAFGQASEARYRIGAPRPIRRRAGEAAKFWSRTDRLGQPK